MFVQLFPHPLGYVLLPPDVDLPQLSLFCSCCSDPSILSMN